MVFYKYFEICVKICEKNMKKWGFVITGLIFMKKIMKTKGFKLELFIFASLTRKKN